MKLLDLNFILGSTLWYHSLQKRVPDGAAAHVNNRTFYALFFDVAKKASLERINISSDFISASKKPSEKSAKKLVRGSLLSKEPRDRTLN